MKTIKYLIALVLLSTTSIQAQDNGALYGLYNNIYAQQNQVGMPNKVDWAFYLPMNLRAAFSTSSPYYNIIDKTDSDNLFKKILNNAEQEEYFILDTRLDLFGIGFSVYGNYIGFGVGVSIFAEMSVPKDFFSFPFNGNYDPSTNTFKNMTLSNYEQHIYQITDLYGIYSTKVNENLTVGAKGKALFVDNVSLSFNDLVIRTVRDASGIGYNYQVDYNLQAKGTASGASVGHLLDKDEPENPSYKFGENLGFALDLGATYEWREFDFYANVENLGFVMMSDKSETVSYKGTTTYKGISIKGLGINNTGDLLNDILENKKDEIDKGKKIERKSYDFELPMSVNFGTLYELNEINKFGVFSENKFFRTHNFYTLQPFYLLDLYGWLQTKIGYNFSNRYNSDLAFVLHINAGVQLSLDVQNIMGLTSNNIQSGNILFGVAFGDFFAPGKDQETTRDQLSLDAPSMPVNTTTIPTSSESEKEMSIGELVDQKSADRVDPSEVIDQMNNKNNDTQSEFKSIENSQDKPIDQEGENKEVIGSSPSEETSTTETPQSDSQQTNTTTTPNTP